MHNWSPTAAADCLVALHLLREFVTQSPETFGEVRYIGTTPLPGYEQPVDVTIVCARGLGITNLHGTHDRTSAGDRTISRILARTPAKSTGDMARTTVLRFQPNWKSGTGTRCSLS